MLDDKDQEIMRLRVAMARAAQRADDGKELGEDLDTVLEQVVEILYDALDFRWTKPRAAGQKQLGASAAAPGDEP